MLEENSITEENKNRPIISGIYKIENLINHKVYIGQSVNIYKRWLVHKSNSINKNSTQYNKHLYSAMRKYGIKNFSFEIIKETYDLDYWEIFLIQIYHATDKRYGYNSTNGGKGTSDWQNNKSNEELNEIKIKKQNTFKNRTKEDNINYSIANKIKANKPENKEKNKIRFIELNKLHPEYRKKAHTKESREKARIAIKESWEHGTMREKLKIYQNSLSELEKRILRAKKSKCVFIENNLFVSTTEASKFYNCTDVCVAQSCRRDIPSTKGIFANKICRYLTEIEKEIYIKLNLPSTYDEIKKYVLENQIPL